MILDIDPKVDFAFKYLLGKESTRPILIDVIDKVLNPPPGHHIRDIELLNPYNLKDAADAKLSIVDIKARDQSGRQFNIEMQMVADASFGKRIVYYASRLHQEQLQEGDDYVKLMPTISISFLNSVLFPQVPDHHLRFRLLEEYHHFALSEDVEFHLLELPKFTKTATELTSGLDSWLYFWRHAAKIDMGAVPAALQQQPMVLRALEELTMLKQSDLERQRYEARRKFQLDYTSGLNDAHRRGLAEGCAEGQMEGISKGEKIGRIHLCELLLKRPETPAEQLYQLSLEELTRLADDLQEQILKQR